MLYNLQYGKKHHKNTKNLADLHMIRRYISKKILKEFYNIHTPEYNSRGNLAKFMLYLFANMGEAGIIIVNEDCRL